MTPPEAMLWVMAGIVIGAYAGAIGAGGGFLVTPVLLLRFQDSPPAEVTAASLVVVAVTSFSASVLSFRERRVDRKLAMGMLMLVVPAGLLGAATTAVVPRAPFALGFGAVLLLIAGYLVFRPVAASVAPVPGRAWRRELIDQDGVRYVYHVPLWRSIAPNVGTGFLSSLAGIGGGPIGVPVMTYIMRVPHAITVPTMHFIIVLQSAAAVTLHLSLGHIGTPMAVVPWLAIGVAAASPLGRLLRRRIGEGRLMQALAVGLLFAAARTMAEGL
ncbi:MAG: sulfite exporter TauE/SafE family protein [Dehalococcoidia bacterium]|nr:sulfite exporter TauE/SafE family protein [Dehalococcoidia bacterium]